MLGARPAALAALLASLLLLPACSLGESSATDAAAPEPATTGPPLEPAPPQELTVQAGTFRAVLRWEPGPGGPPLDQYDVYRNGRLVGSVPGHATEYVDRDVLPRAEYRWEIAARAGDLASERVRVSARMKVPPIAQARLEGDFSVNATVTSRSGYDTLGKALERGWRFTPRCLDGACRRVAWHDLDTKRLRGVLTRRGGTYTGTYSGWFFIHCRGTRTTSSVSIELRVTRARTIQGRWHATRLTGTITSSETPQLGCVLARATRSVRARLHPFSLE